MNLPHIRFQVKLQEKKPGDSGLDKAQFCFRLTGRRIKAFIPDCFGREISRFVLALKGSGPVYSFPDFDEIDME